MQCFDRWNTEQKLGKYAYNTIFDHDGTDDVVFWLGYYELLECEQPI